MDDFHDQCILILTPCLTGLAQDVVDALDPGDAANCAKVNQAILSTLNLSEKFIEDASAS